MWCLCLFLVIAELSLVSAQNCPRYWFRNNEESYCYRYFSGLQTWQKAQDICETYGANLASIKDESENDFVFKLQGYGCNNGIWIGLSDIVTEGTFKWFDGNALVYENWHVDEPDNNGDQDCVEIDGSRGVDYSKWNDAVCTDTKPFVCKWFLPL
ncbi:perlucin-like protein [Saccoglossus kowalevskii]|uniref:C-type mannose receptor 2-like n=1 Tax=Saccoglossus kowalevskii TaxID=10224 RepID=A0A0U2SR89_SACKO|nr:PREDICTED: C-type mannose receptor 2-like [Saccoglossus kowalevskii]ALR88642.1 lithostathine-like protein109 [Saccoglossus kowalevskii]